MRVILFLIALAVIINVVISDQVLAQSPYYSINVSIKKEPADRSLYTYSYYYKLCEPLEWSTKGETFDHDTSKVDWKNLPQSFINSLTCKYIESENDSIFNFGNQLMSYEHVSNITIVRKMNTTADTMIIVFPIRIKSFVTFVDLKDISFRKGLFEIDEGMEYSISGMKTWLKLREGYELTPLSESRQYIN